MMEDIEILAEAIGYTVDHVKEREVVSLGTALAAIKLARGKSLDWISVKDAMPEVSQRVLFIVVNSPPIYNHFNGKVYGGVYTAYGQFSTPGIGFEASHWMPSPEPLTLTELKTK